MKILRKRLSDLMNYEAVYRTAPATLGLLKRGGGNCVQNYCQLVHRTYQSTYQSIKVNYNTLKTSVYIKVHQDRSKYISVHYIKAVYIKDMRTHQSIQGYNKVK